MPNEAICRGNVQSYFCYLNNGAKEPLHTVVKEAMTIHRMHVLSKIVELGNWKITYENCGMIAGLSTCGLWDIVDWPGFGSVRVRGSWART